MGNPQPLFRSFLSFKQTLKLLTTNKCVKMYIQYMVLGFEHTTIGLDQGSLPPYLSHFFGIQICSVAWDRTLKSSNEMLLSYSAALK